MKKVIIFSLLLTLTITSFSQQTKSTPTLTKQDYLKKSINQKKIGSLLLAGGAVLITTAIIIPKGELVKEGIYCAPGSGILCNPEYKNDGIKSAFFIAGSISSLSSIPLFILSGKNRRKATTVSFKNENTVHLYKQNLVYTSFPALRLKVNF